MIYEFRTYDLKPRTLGQYGYWYSEFGLLNQALHIWPYDDLQQRTEVREEVNGIDFWPPATADLLTAQNTEIYLPAPFNDEAITGDHGPYYELRTYTYATGDTPKVIEAWSKAIQERRKHSAFIGAWFSELGDLNKWAHMWAYKSLDERTKVRSDMIERKIWPPADK